MNRFIHSLLVVFFALLCAGESLALPTIQKSNTQINMENTATQFAKALNEQDVNDMRNILNIEPLAVDLVKLIFPDSDASQKRTFIQSFEKGFYQDSVGTWFESLRRSGGEARFLRLIYVDGEQRALVRLDLKDEGINFMELIFDKNQNKIVDIFAHTTGQKFSETLTSIMALAIPNNNNLLKRMLGVGKINQKVVTVFQSIAQHNRLGQLDRAYETLTQLPQDVQANRVIAILKTTYAPYASEEAYKSELDQLAKLFEEDPSLALMLVDHYFYREDYQRAIKSLLMIEERIGEDSIINSLIAIALHLDNQGDAALKKINRSIQMDESLEDLYWRKVEILNKLARYDNLVVLLDDMRDRFDLMFDPTIYEQEASYQGFVRSKAFKEWRKQY